MTSKPEWVRPIEEAGGIPVMLLPQALEGVDAADVVRLLVEDGLTIYRAGDALLASRPTVEMALEVRRAAKHRRSASYGKTLAGSDAA